MPPPPAAPAAKRRKKNDSSSAAKAKAVVSNRGLEYFWGKGKEGGDSKGSEGSEGKKRKIDGVVDGDGIDDGEMEVVEDDEVVARRLHALLNGDGDGGPGEGDEKMFGKKEKIRDNKSDRDEAANEGEDKINEGEIKEKEKQIEENNPQETISSPAPAPAQIPIPIPIQLPVQQPPPPTTTLPPLHTPLNTYPLPLPLSSAPPLPIPYTLLAHTFTNLQSTRSRLLIQTLLTNLLRTIIYYDPQSLLPAVWLCTNSIGPDYEGGGTELGIGGGLLGKAMERVGGVGRREVRRVYAECGDWGDVAARVGGRQRRLFVGGGGAGGGGGGAIKHVYTTLVKIANTKGPGSQDAKQRMVERLLVMAEGPEEARYLARTFVQNLRIGAVKTTMLIALSRAFLYTPPPGATSARKETEDEENKNDQEQPPRPQVLTPNLPKETLTDLHLRAEEAVKRCFARRPNYNDLVPALLEGGTEGLEERCGLRLGVPVKPMLGCITRGLGEVVAGLGGKGRGRDVAVEFKKKNIDGQRAQIHYDSNGKISIFSRHLELMTDKYPDLVSLIPHIIKPRDTPDNPGNPGTTTPPPPPPATTSFILEGEVVAIDRPTNTLKHFQDLSSRARKNVSLADIKVDVCLFAFDLMYLNGEELLGRTLRERRGLLRERFTEIEGRFGWVESIDARLGGGGGDGGDGVGGEAEMEMEKVRRFFVEVVGKGGEGVMVKMLDNEEVAVEGGEKEREGGNEKEKGKQGNGGSGNGREGRRKALLATYEPDKRLESWLKVKKDYDIAAADTLDLVPIAAWRGTGRKAKWWSPILLAVYSPETGTFQALCKCISGFTDTFYRRVYENKPTSLPKKPPYVDCPSSLSPDIWFEPQEVWEMLFAEVTRSPVYPAARGMVSGGGGGGGGNMDFEGWDEGGERGLSLRFPRFMRVRDDKGVHEASTVEELVGLFERQVRGGGGGGGGGGEKSASSKVDAEGREGDVEELEEEEEGNMEDGEEGGIIPDIDIDPEAGPDL
ncbi:hypothetical protein DFH27DRAFT_596019 [Peziza echinospora]|nr:hypothetical protein DFH27DRAFT_596019 [Peziza echinospora]